MALSLVLFHPTLVPRNGECINTMMGFPSSSGSKASACSTGDLGSIHGLGRPLEKEMATHSSVLAWEISWTKEPGG